MVILPRLKLKLGLSMDRAVPSKLLDSCVDRCSEEAVSNLFIQLIGVNFLRLGTGHLREYQGRAVVWQLSSALHLRLLLRRVKKHRHKQ